MEKFKDLLVGVKDSYYDFVVGVLNYAKRKSSSCDAIPQTTISDWRKKRTNPTAEKLLIICEVLKVTPEWLLSGIEAQGDRGNPPKKYVVDYETEPGILIECFNSLDKASQAHLLGYAMGLKKMQEEKQSRMEEKTVVDNE